MKRFFTLALLALIAAAASPAQAQTAQKKSGTSSSTSASAKNKASKSTGSATKSKSVPTSKTGNDKANAAPEPNNKDKNTAKTADENINEGPETEGPPVAAVSSIAAEDIEGFEYYAPQIQELIRSALALTRQNLTYTFGSADPRNGGMDCSGTIYYVLHEFGFKDVPRQSNEMAGWVQDKTLLHRVNGADALTHPEFGALQPGNLLFWSGTYQTAPRKIPVTHVMIYLGKLKSNGKQIVFGASDGRAYQGKRRTGVSVFDFSLPRTSSNATFYGYGMIPGVGKIEVKPRPVVLAENTPPSDAAPAPAPATTEPPANKKDATSAVPAPGGQQSNKKYNTPHTIRSSQQAQVTAATTTREKAAREAAAETLKEEVRPAIRIGQQPAKITSATPPQKTAAAAQTKAGTDANAPPGKPKSSAPQSKATAGTSRTQAKKSTASSQTRSSPRKRAPAPPPSPLNRARQAVGSFFQEVRR